MLKRILVICAALLAAFQMPVHAYTDPGSGTLIWQMLIAASFGVMFYLRRILRWVRGLRSAKEQTGSAESAAAESDAKAESARGQVL